MIGKLRGLVDTIGSGEVILDVGGVGYLVHCGARTLRTLSPGDTAVLHIETMLRQDMLRLYGFASEEERAWFVRLQDIQGVGAKSAFNILDVLSPAELMNAAALEDKASVARAQGVGPRLAARIVGELKDKPAPTGRGLETLSAPVAPTGDPEAAADATRTREAISALVNLGLSGPDAQRAIARAARDLGADAPLDALIRAALKASGQ